MRRIETISHPVQCGARVHLKPQLKPQSQLLNVAR